MCIFGIFEGMNPDTLKDIGEPEDYFQGRGHLFPFPTPKEILLFVRRDRKNLQQNALQNRSHHRWVLMFNLGTAGQVHVDQHTLRLSPGEAVLIQPFQFHHFTHLESEPLLWLFCTFELESAPILDPLRYQVVPVEDRVLSARHALLAAWRSMEEKESTESLSGARLQAALLTLLLELRESVQTTAPYPRTEPKNRLLEKLNRLLDRRADRPQTVSGLADQLSMSSSALRVKFQEVAGVPLGAYLKSHRIHRAMLFLRTTDQSVGMIATEVGYSSPPAFSRAFLAATGKTPLNYRRDV